MLTLTYASEATQPTRGGDDRGDLITWLGGTLQRYPTRDPIED